MEDLLFGFFRCQEKAPEYPGKTSSASLLPMVRGMRHVPCYSSWWKQGNEKVKRGAWCSSLANPLHERRPHHVRDHSAEEREEGREVLAVGAADGTVPA